MQDDISQSGKVMARLVFSLFLHYGLYSVNGLLLLSVQEQVPLTLLA